jgi:hypothetical protein
MTNHFPRTGITAYRMHDRCVDSAESPRWYTISAFTFAATHAWSVANAASFRAAPRLSGGKTRLRASKQ